MLPEDEKKWQITRIEYLLNGYSDELRLHNEQFEIFKNEQQSKFLNIRNYILASVSFAVTVTLGLAAIDPVKSYLLQLLLIAISVGVISFFVLSLLKTKVTSELDKVSYEYLNVIYNSYVMKGFLSQVSTELENYDLARISILRKCMIIIYGNRVNLYQAIKQCSDSILFLKSNKLKELMETEDQTMTNTINIFKKCENEFEEDLKTKQPIVKRLGYLITPLLRFKQYSTSLNLEDKSNVPSVDKI